MPSRTSTNTRFKGFDVGKLTLAVEHEVREHRTRIATLEQHVSRICRPRKVKFQKVSPIAKLPTRASAEAAGYDLYTVEPIILKPGTSALVPLGICSELPRGYEAQIRPRSGLAKKHNVTVTNAPGTIDSDYRGEWKVLLMNLDKDRCFSALAGERIAQAVFAKVATVELVEVVELAVSDRGEGGFGSTGR